MGPKPSEGSEVAHKLKNTGLDHNFPRFEETVSTRRSIQVQLVEKTQRFPRTTGRESSPRSGDHERSQDWSSEGL